MVYRAHHSAANAVSERNPRLARAGIGDTLACITGGMAEAFYGHPGRNRQHHLAPPARRLPLCYKPAHSRTIFAASTNNTEPAIMRKPKQPKSSAKWSHKHDYPIEEVGTRRTP